MRRLQQLGGFGAESTFYDGVSTVDDFAANFCPIAPDSRLSEACRSVWQQFHYEEPDRLANSATMLAEYFKLLLSGKVLCCRLVAKIVKCRRSGVPPDNTEGEGFYCVLAGEPFA